MRYTIPTLLLIAGLITQCKPTPGYTITGSLTGLPDNTWLYLDTDSSNTHIDSCQLKNGQFSMKGAIYEKALLANLYTTPDKDHLNFWLENTAIQITATAGALAKAGVTGSATEEENKLYQQALHVAKQRMDSIDNLFQEGKEATMSWEMLQKIEAAEIQKQNEDKNWVRTHPNSLVATHLLDFYAIVWGKDTTQELYNHLSADMKATRYGRSIADFIALNQSVDTGKKYADFEQPDTTGKMTKLSQIKAKYVLLDFWASWCHPCRDENRSLITTFNRFTNKGFTIVGVSLDERKADWLKAINDDKLRWTNLCDLQGTKNKAALTYGIRSIPDNFLIDESGTIIARNLRGNDLEEKLETLLP